MIRRALVLALLAGGATAYADTGNPDSVPSISTSAPGISPEGAIAPISIVEGPGVKVGEGTVLHPIFGFETGYVSNVFYTANNPTGAGILRLIAQIGAGSLTPQRLAASNDPETDNHENSGVLQYRADLRATYDIYLSGKDSVGSQDGLGIGALFRGIVNPKHTWSFLYLEDFQRLIRSTNFESSAQTNRDINHLQLGLQYAPVDHNVSGLLHFEDVVDVFEASNQQFANRNQNSAGLTVSWRVRPVTVLYVDGTMGLYSGLGADSKKVTSYPLLAQVGVQTLLSLNTTVVAHVGYTNGFYSAGPSFSAIVGGVQVGYRYANTGRITALYDYSHQDSINANYFRDHEIAMVLEQQFTPAFVLSLQPELRFREYQGVQQIVMAPTNTRDDVILAVSAGIRYNFRDWFAAVLQYRLSSVQTDFRYMVNGVTDDPSYVRHEIVAGVRAAL